VYNLEFAVLFDVALSILICSCHGSVSALDI